jgi:hypothetical protein
MKRKFLNSGFGTKTLLGIVFLICTTVFSGCYEKESIDVEEITPPQPVSYYIAGVVTDYNSGGVLSGAGVSIAGYTAVTTGEFGQFSVKLNDETPNPEGYTVKISYNGYDEVIRQVYISAVGQGLISITTANVALRVTGTGTGTPPPPVEDANKTVSTAETATAATGLADDINQNLLSTEKKEQLVESISGNIPGNVKDAIGQVTVGTATVVAGQDGVINVSTPVSFAGSVKAQDASQMTYAYNLVSGFEVRGDIKEVSAPSTKSTKSAGDKISDATLIALFESAVAAELNMSKGFSAVAATVNYPIPAGKKVVGYTITDRIELQYHTYLINGKYVSGPVAVYVITSVIPVYEDLPADTHDSHDGSGHDPNMGGGSGE